MDQVTRAQTGEQESANVQRWRDASDDELIAQVQLDSPEWLNPLALVTVDDVRAFRVAYARLAHLMRSEDFRDLLVTITTCLERYDDAAKDLACDGDESPFYVVGRAVGAKQLLDLAGLLHDWASIASDDGVAMLKRDEVERVASEAGVTIPATLNPQLPKHLQRD